MPRVQPSQAEVNQQQTNQEANEALAAANLENFNEGERRRRRSSLPTRAEQSPKQFAQAEEKASAKKPKKEDEKLAPGAREHTNDVFLHDHDKLSYASRELAWGLLMFFVDLGKMIFKLFGTLTDSVSSALGYKEAADNPQSDEDAFTANDATGEPDNLQIEQRVAAEPTNDEAAELADAPELRVDDEAALAASPSTRN